MKPNSYGEYMMMRAETPHLIRYTECIHCSSPFTNSVVRTMCGWRETQTTGYCEVCFDKLFPETYEEDDCC